MTRVTIYHPSGLTAKVHPRTVPAWRRAGWDTKRTTKKTAPVAENTTTTEKE